MQRLAKKTKYIHRERAREGERMESKKLITYREQMKGRQREWSEARRKNRLK